MNSVDLHVAEGKGGVGVLDKTVALMAFLAEGGPATLAEVVGATGISRPTAHRLLRALEAHHLVARRAGTPGRYALGSRLLGWGEKAGGDLGLLEAARPALERLREETGESAQLYVREGEGRVCVASVERASGLKTTVAVGAVLPLDRGSAGRVLISWSEDAAGFGVPPERLAEVRRRGWAESVAEREEGVASVSAPVFGGGGRVVAAVGVSGPIARLGTRPGERLAAPVVSAAREIGETLGASRGPGAGLRWS